MKRFRAITSLIIAMTVVFSAALPIFADNTPSGDINIPSLGTEPKITIMGSPIKKNDDFFELGVKVEPGSAGFLSVGVVLEYDRDRIVPVAWDEAGTEVVGSDRTSWRDVASLPALCPTEISGKVAFAYNPQPSPSASPDPDATQAPETTDTPETSPAPEEPPVQTVEDGDDTPETTDVPETTTAPEATTDPSVTAAPTSAPEDPGEIENKGYLCLSAEAPNRMTADKVAGLSDERVITVRFKYVANVPDDADAETVKAAKLAAKASVLNSFESGHGAVRLAPVDIADASHIGQMVMYCTGATVVDPDGVNDEVVEYYYIHDNNIEQGIKYDNLLSEPPKFVLKELEKSSNTGGGGTFVPIVFFDWDGKTLLGSLAVEAGSDQTDVVKALTNTLKDPNLPAGSLYSADKNYPMTNKKGYSFEDVWIDFESELRTHYGATVSSEIIPKPTPEDYPNDVVDFANVTEGKLVKAVYNSNSEIDTSNRNYTVEVIDFNRFAATANYSVTIRIKRENSNGKGVPRTGTPAVRVNMRAGSNSFFFLYNIDNVDETTLEIAASSAITSVQANIIDTYGVSNWVSAPTRCANEMSYAVPTSGKPGFMYEGSLSSISTQTEEWVAGGANPAYNLTVLNNATTGLGLNTKDNKNKNLNINTVKTNIKNAWLTKNNLKADGSDYNPNTEYQRLTIADISAVLDAMR